MDIKDVIGSRILYIFKYVRKECPSVNEIIEKIREVGDIVPSVKL